MQRRDFLKGVLGAAATIAAIHLALPEEAATQIIQVPKKRIYTRAARCWFTSFGDYAFGVPGDPDPNNFYIKHRFEFWVGIGAGFTYESFSASISEQMDAYLDPYMLLCLHQRRRYVPKTKPIPMSVQAAAFYLTLTPTRDEKISPAMRHLYIPQQRLVYA